MDALDAVERAEELLPKPLEQGLLDLGAVLQSDYFFAGWAPKNNWLQYEERVSGV
ncbi:hypothetical protein [Aureimonas mangrovi]|uniref:hypothetical protein n=1 Tax=Aureimonas mangrovi TaxID=2758041 RepID=UPI00163D8AB9|nr:hypothetical protein [Aureimonas mangrovi]